MIIGERNNQLIRIPARRACNGYYIRWYYNGWHYWFFLPGDHSILTEGERYRTISTRKILLSTGQITLAEAIAIRTILHTREVYLWTNSGWANIRIEPGTLNVYNNMVNGEELEFVAIIGSKEVSYDSGFSPVVQLQEIASDIEYCEVVIGTQIWMCYNWDAAYPGSKVYGEDESNRSLFGGLYSWAQVMSPGFVPEGWHIPTRAEWQTLKDYLGGDAVAGGHLKSLGLTYWDPPNTGATNEVGFNARGSGYAYKNTFSGAIVYANKLKHTYFWTADEASSLNAYANLLRYNDALAYELPTNKLLNYLSVRLIKDGVAPFVPPFVPPVDVDGVVTIDVTERGYLATTKSPYVHAMTHYGDYLYCVGRNPENGGVTNMIKIKKTDYSDKLYTEIRYSSDTDPHAIYFAEQLVRVGTYLYAVAFAPVGGVDTNLMIQYNISNDTYKIFKLPSTYGIMYGTPIFTDGTNLYVLPNIIEGDDCPVIKYLASDFQNPAWGKYNTAYGDTGVPISPVDTLDLSGVSADYYGYHAATTDATHAYLSFRDGYFGPASKLLKLQFSTFTIVDTADVPAASDDIVNTATHVFLGAEGSEYQPTWATIAVRKSDMAVTALIKHSTEAAYKGSYGVLLGTIDGVEYLFNLRTDGKIYVIDISNPDGWSPAGSADAYILRLISFVFSDAPTVHNTAPSELIVDENETLHVTTWGTTTELVQFKLAPLP